MTTLRHFAVDTFLSAVADLLDGSSDRYARAFGPLIVDGKARTSRRMRPVPLFRPLATAH